MENEMQDALLILEKIAANRILFTRTAGELCIVYSISP